MIAAGANPEAKNQEGQTPVPLAASKGHVGLVKKMLCLKKVPNERKTFLEFSKVPGPDDLANALRESGALETKIPFGGPRNKCTILHFAVVFGDFDFVQALLLHGADPSSQWDGTYEGEPGIVQTPLHQAVRHGRLDMVKALLAAGSDVNVFDESPRYVTLPGQTSCGNRSKTSSQPTRKSWQLRTESIAGLCMMKPKSQFAETVESGSIIYGRFRKTTREALEFGAKKDQPNTTMPMATMR